MNIGIFFIVLFFCFALLCFLFPKLKGNILYTLAIGGAINANIFNVETYGFNILNIRLGIDSILYSLFIFCLIISYIKLGKKHAVELMYYTIGSIIFSSVISFFGIYLASGYESSVIIWSLISFNVSAIASLIACSIMFLVADFMKTNDTPNFLVVFVMFIIAMVLNTIIFYGIMQILNGVSNDIWQTLLGNALGKILCLIVGAISILIISIIENKTKKQIK